MNRDDAQWELVQQAVDGDVVALKLLLTDTRVRLCTHIQRRVPARLHGMLAAEDVVQQAHIEVFRRIAGFEWRGPDSFYRWLATIALSRLRNAIRHQTSIKRGGGWTPVGPFAGNFEESAVELLDLLAGPDETPSRCVARSEAALAVRSALAELPEDNRRALWLVHFEGCSAKAAAAQMGRTERAVHGLCHRGLKLLRSHLRSATRFLSSAG